jgi:hypothetical protein
VNEPERAKTEVVDLHVHRLLTQLTTAQLQLAVLRKRLGQLDVNLGTPGLAIVERMESTHHAMRDTLCDHLLKWPEPSSRRAIEDDRDAE